MMKLLLLSFLALVLSACGRPDELKQNTAITEHVNNTPGLIEHHYVDSIDGTHKLHYVSNKRQAEPRPVLVFIHGTPGSWSSFSRYFLDPELNQKYRLISIDRPSWGESGYSGQILPTHLQLQSNEIGPLLKHIWNQSGEQKIYLIGHSLGASLAPLLAVDYAKIVAGTIMLAGDVSPKFAAPRWYNTLLDWLPNALVSQKWQHSNDEVLQLSASLKDIRSKFMQLNSPLIILQGKQDTLVEPANAEVAQTLFKNNHTEVVWLEEAGHIIHMTHMNKVKDAIEKIVTLSAKTE
ncbi:alpha/beta fold hydrolase [Marinomonas sp.]